MPYREHSLPLRFQNVSGILCSPHPRHVEACSVICFGVPLVIAVIAAHGTTAASFLAEATHLDVSPDTRTWALVTVLPLDVLYMMARHAAAQIMIWSHSITQVDAFISIAAGLTLESGSTAADQLVDRTDLALVIWPLPNPLSHLNPLGHQR